MALVLMSSTNAFADEWFECSPSNIAYIDSGVMIYCKAGWQPTGLPSPVDRLFFPDADEEKFKRIVSLATYAYESHNIFLAYLTTAQSGNYSPCNATECRAPLYFGVKRRQ